MGFVFTTYSAASGIISVIIGRLYKFVPFCLFILIAVIVSLTLSFFLIFWEREPNFIVIFGFTIGWGWCDASWQTVNQSKLLNNNNIIDIIIIIIIIAVLTGVLFEDKESAYSILQLAVSVSFTIGFILPLFSGTVVQLSIIIIIVITASVTITILSINISNRPHCTHFSKCRNFFI